MPPQCKGIAIGWFFLNAMVCSHSIPPFQSSDTLMVYVISGPGPWSRVLGPGSLVPGPWSRVLGPRPLVPGPWSRVLGPRSLVPGHWVQLIQRPLQMYNLPFETSPTKFPKGIQRVLRFHGELPYCIPLFSEQQKQSPKHRYAQTGV